VATLCMHAAIGHRCSANVAVSNHSAQEPVSPCSYHGARDCAVFPAGRAPGGRRPCPYLYHNSPHATVWGPLKSSARVVCMPPFAAMIKEGSSQGPQRTQWRTHSRSSAECAEEQSGQAVSAEHSVAQPCNTHAPAVVKVWRWLPLTGSWCSWES
jgi:hypothetical protein